MESPTISKLIEKNKWHKWSITIKIIPVIILIALFKIGVHYFDLEVMELNALFTSIVAGTIFLIGFLISGVLSDYKESEKIPSEVATCFKSLIDDADTIHQSKNNQTALDLMLFHQQNIQYFIDWLYKKESTISLLQRISAMNAYFIQLDQEGILPPYLIKMKNDQSNLRKMILRIDTIRETNFIGTAYAIVEIMAYILGVGLIIMKIDPFYVAMFFTLIVTFLITYMLNLIKDIDDPFDYATNGETGTEICLKPIYDLQKELETFKVN